MSTVAPFVSFSAVKAKRRRASGGGRRIQLGLVVALIVIAVAPFLLMVVSVARNAQQSQSDKLDVQTMLMLQTSATRLNSHLYAADERAKTTASKVAAQLAWHPKSAKGITLPADTQLHLADGRTVGDIPAGSITRSVGIRDANGKVLGSLVQALPLNEKMLSQLPAGAPVDGTLAVVSDHGQISSGPAAMVGASVPTKGDVELDGRMYRSYSTQVGDGHRLHVLSPEDELNEQLHGLRTKLIVSGVGVLAALAVLLFLIAKPLAHQARSLSRSAGVDELTQLPNRREYHRTIADEVARSKRYQSPFSLVLLDIDNFKKLNDKHGHPAGDEALYQLSRTLELTVRDVDTAARVGGDEFAVILPETSLADAEQLAERIRTAITEISFQAGEHTITLTASIGVASSAHFDDAEELYRGADEALYRAKRDRNDSRVT